MTPSQRDVTIIDSLRRLAEQRPSDFFCAFMMDGTVREISFGELFSHAQAYAAHITRVGLGPADIVFIILRHRPDLLYAFVGALIAGCIPSFLAPASDRQDPQAFWKTLRHLFEDVGAAAAVVDPADFETITQAIGPIPVKLIAPIECAGVDEPISWAAPEPNDIAFLQFSSGTTGLRKGVMLTHQVVIEQIEAYRSALNLERNDRIASWLPLYHDMGLVACFIMPLIMGIPVVMLDAFEWVNRPALLLDAITRYRATLIWLPNFAFNHLCATVPSDSRYDLGSVRAFINCSEPCKIESMRRFSEHFRPMNVRSEQLHTCYAMAEAAFAVTQSEPGTPPTTLAVLRDDFLTNHRVIATNGDDNGVSMELVSVGRPLPGFKIRVLGPDRRDLPPDHVGELAICGPSVFTGYYRAAEATAESFADGWYLTGDLGFVQGDAVFVTGRRKDIIIAYGKNYYSHDIEALVGDVDGIKAGRAVAFGLYNATSGSEDVIVLAETDETQPRARRQIANIAKSAIAAGLGLAVSVSLVPPRWLIKTTSGKLNRAQNRDKYLRMTTAPSKTLAP
jgi:fatty-acyl-CoA synthase